MRKFALAILMTMSILIGTTQLQADDSDLFKIRVSPDALIALDLSGSMNSPPPGDYGYSNAKTYEYGEDYCSGDRVYGRPTGAYNQRCRNHAFPSGHVYTASEACTEPYYKYSNSNKVDCSKLAIAKRAIRDLLDANGDGKIQTVDQEILNTRIGYMRFRGCCVEDPSVDYEGGCNTIQFKFPTSDDSKFFDYDKLYKKVDGEDIPDGLPGYRTPLASQLREAKEYLDHHKKGVLPAASTPDPARECRNKFIILITDGWDTCACKHNCKKSESETGSYGYMRRRATLAAVKPAIDAGYQVFVVGFGADMPQTEANTLEWCAFYGGTDNPMVENSGLTSAIPSSALYENPCTSFDACKDENNQPSQSNCVNAPNDPGYKDLSGYAFLAQDATKLSKALSTIFYYITEKAFFYAAPTIPSVRTVAEDIAYLSSFTPSTAPFWQGSLKAYRLNRDGTLPVDEKGYVNVAPIWDASQKLNEKSHESRSIYTYVRGEKKEFRYNNLTNEDLGVTADQGRADLINHIRGGIDAYDVDQDGNKTELRSWKLGDIFHSAAVIIGKPSPSFIDSGYSGTGGFYENNRKRTKVVIAGANDGMLHAFHAGDWIESEEKYDHGTGEEVWAFIPSALLPNLKSMTSAHTYYVDGSPRVSDVWFYSSSDQTGENKSVDEWKTVLICGLRKGGKHYFALDVTDTLNPKYLWEFPKSTDSTTLAKVGQSWSDPAIGRVRIEEGGKLKERWVAFIGGGFDNTNASGKALFVIDLTNGNILKEFSGLSGMNFSFAAPPTALDTNFDGCIDKVYIGDLAGQMWVFDVSSNRIMDWKGKVLFWPPGAPSLRNPIYYQPAVALDPQRNLWVYFGTGDRENPTDDKSEESFYAVKDDGKGDYPRKKEDLAKLTTANNFKSDPLTKGWYIELAKGEKVLAKPTVFRKLLYFTTYSPKTSTDPCNRAGDAALYIVEYLSAGGAFGLGDYLAGNPSDRSSVIGEGIPSAPVISVGLEGKAIVIVRTTSGGGGPGSGSAGGPGSGPGGGGGTAPPDENPKKILYWREIIY